MHGGDTVTSQQQTNTTTQCQHDGSAWDGYTAPSDQHTALIYNNSLSPQPTTVLDYALTSVPTSHHIVNTHSNSLFYLETNVPECDFDLFDLFDMGHQYIRDGYMVSTSHYTATIYGNNLSPPETTAPECGLDLLCLEWLHMCAWRTPDT